MGDGVKYGKDEDLERAADELLREGVGRNKRSVARDVEKLSYESGFISRDELRVYDPTNDWDTLDEVFVIPVSDVDSVEPSLCTDGNVRARSREDPKIPVGTWGRAGEEERRGLACHVGDDDSWGSAREYIPLLGINEGPRKTCARCGHSKGLSLFSPKGDSRDRLHPWCKECRKGFVSQRRRIRRSEN